MVEILKQLDGQVCLGETLRVRKIGEETTEANAQAAVIALQAFSRLTNTKFTKARPTEENEEAEEQFQCEAGPVTLAAKTTSLKTLNPSRILKISNVFDREMELTPDIYEELKEDFEAEMQGIH